MKKRVICLALLAPIMALSIPTPATVASEQETQCGIYKVSKNEVIAGVKFPKGSYQIYTYNIACNKVLGKKGILETFLKQKDKDPLPKPWRYESVTVGAQSFSRSGVGFRVEYIGSATTSGTSPAGNTAPMPAGIKAALDDLDKFPKSKQAPQQIKFHFGPNADKRLSDLIVKNSNETMKFFVDFHQSSIPFPVIYSSPQDKDWAIAEMAKYGHKLREWTEERQLFDPALGGDWKGDHLYWFYQEDWSGERGAPGKSGWHLYSVTRQDFVIHHVVHGIQNRITGDKDRYLGLWAREGGATFYAWYILGRTFPEIGHSSAGNVTYSVWRSQQTKPFQPWFAPTLNLQELNETEWLSFIKSWDCNIYKYPTGAGGTIEKSCPEVQHRQLAYNTGAVMYERLVGEFGHQKVMDWWYELRTTPDWEEAFAKTFKINVDDWYKGSAIPYLMQVFRNWVSIPSK
jgi:hypothetical protein